MDILDHSSVPLYDPLLALAVVYDGGSRSDGARAGGVGLQTFRDWVLRFNAAGPTGLVDGKAPGQAPRLDQAQRDELARLIEDGPIPAVHGVVRWRLSDLAQWVMERSIAPRSASRHSAGICERWATANCRPGRAITRRTAKPWRHFKKTSLRRLAEITARDAPGKPIEVWFRGRSQDRPEEQDHAPLGQARQQAVSAVRPTHGIDVHLRRDLPRARRRRRLRTAVVQQHDDGPAPRRDFAGRFARCTRR